MTQLNFSPHLMSFGQLRSSTCSRQAFYKHPLIRLQDDLASQLCGAKLLDMSDNIHFLKQLLFSLLKNLIKSVFFRTASAILHQEQAFPIEVERGHSLQGLE